VALLARQALAHCLKPLERTVCTVRARENKVHDVERIDLGAVEASGTVDWIRGSQARTVLASRAAEALSLTKGRLIGASRALNWRGPVDAIRACRAEASSFAWERRREHGLSSACALKPVAARVRREISQLSFLVAIGARWASETLCDACIQGSVTGSADRAGYLDGSALGAVVARVARAALGSNCWRGSGGARLAEVASSALA